MQIMYRPYQLCFNATSPLRQGPWLLQPCSAALTMKVRDAVNYPLSARTSLQVRFGLHKWQMALNIRILHVM